MGLSGPIIKFSWTLTKGNWIIKEEIDSEQRMVIKKTTMKTGHCPVHWETG